MAFKIWCETPEDLYCIVEELENDCGFNLPDCDDIEAPVGIIARLDTINFVDRKTFETDDAEPYGITDEYPNNVVTFLADHGGVWITNEKDFETFVFLIEDDFTLLVNTPTLPCGFYTANPEQLACSANTNHAKHWSNFINGELRTYRLNNSTITTTYSDETEDTMTIENWYVEPLTIPLSDEEFEEIAKQLNKLQSQAEDIESTTTYARSDEDNVNHPRQAKPHAEEVNDAVNHPTHYAKSCSLECIDVIHALLGDEYTYAACLFNAFKYLWRYKHKGHPAEDLDKAAWYLDRAEAISDATDGYVDDDPLERITELYLAIRRKEKDNG